MIWYLGVTISFALSGILIYIYYLQKGQFDECEDVKYQMFREEALPQQNQSSFKQETVSKNE